jgi:farnesyl diphosphate synthase
MLNSPNLPTATADRLDHYAKCIGLAFQIQDDILDVEGDTQTLGKNQGADQSLNKPTYPSLVGVEQARNMARDLVSDALQSLSEFNYLADPLRWLAQYVIDRRY